MKSLRLYFLGLFSGFSMISYKNVPGKVLLQQNMHGNNIQKEGLLILKNAHCYIQNTDAWKKVFLRKRLRHFYKTQDFFLSFFSLKYFLQNYISCDLTLRLYQQCPFYFRKKSKELKTQDFISSDILSQDFKKWDFFTKVFISRFFSHKLFSGRFQ